MMVYGGLDLHGSNTYVCIIDEKDRQLVRRKFPNDLHLLLKALEPFREDIDGLVVESTFNWYWLVDGLIENGYNVHLANPAGNKRYEGLKHTTDSDDAFWLSHLLRLGILQEGHIYPKEERFIRDLLRKRLFLVRQRTANILSFQSLYNRHTGQSISSNEIKKLKVADIDELFVNEHVILSARANISTVLFLNEQIRVIEKEVLKETKLKPEFEKLLTVPGIGTILALTISLETGDIGRFKKVGNYASYSRCVESRRESNGKKKGENNRKNGNKYLSWAFIEAANYCKRYDPLAKIFFQKKASKTKNVVAIKALAHKLARACFYIMRDQVDYDPLKIFGKHKTGCGSEPSKGLE
jgi:transposase